MIPVTGAGWSQVSGGAVVTEGASATATEDRIVVRWASANGAAGARVEPRCTHGQRQLLGVLATPGDREHRAAASGEPPVDAGDNTPCSLQGVGERRVGPARRWLERAPEELELGRHRCRLWSSALSTRSPDGGQVWRGR